MGVAIGDAREDRTFIFLYSYVYIDILLFVHGSPSGRKPDLQEAMLKKKN